MKIFLLKKYNRNNEGKIIEVNNNLASKLITNGTAKKADSKDFIIQTNFGETKAFGSSPS